MVLCAGHVREAVEETAAGHVREAVQGTTAQSIKTQDPQPQLLLPRTFKIFQSHDPLLN